MVQSILVFLSALVCVCFGHLCMISPPQRGSMVGLNKAGSADCILLTSPCGGRKQSRHGITLMAGEQFTVTFQKNLDHYNKVSPGYFAVSIGPDESTMKTILSVKDTSDPSLTLYSMNVTMPMTQGHMILQSRYVTQNPKAPPVFYQCSDVNIMQKHQVVMH